jgi:hypothetical protein
MKTVIAALPRFARITIFLLLLAPAAYAAKFHLVEQDQNGDQRSCRRTVTVLIWDAAMVMRTQFEFAGPSIILDGHQFPGRGPWTMVVYEGKREVWRRQVDKGTGDGDGMGALIVIPSGR